MATRLTCRAAERSACVSDIVRSTTLSVSSKCSKRPYRASAGFNLGLLMRQLIGVGTPRGLQGRLLVVVATLSALIRPLWSCVTGHRRPGELDSAIARPA